MLIARSEATRQSMNGGPQAQWPLSIWLRFHTNSLNNEFKGAEHPQTYARGGGRLGLAAAEAAQAQTPEAFYKGRNIRS